MVEENIASLNEALKWLQASIDSCLQVHFDRAQCFDVQPLSFSSDNVPLVRFISTYNPSFEEFSILLLGLVSHIQPNFFNQIVSRYLPEGGDLPEFGGVKGGQHRGIIPTGETAQFILAGDDLEKRLEVQRILSHEHWLAKQRILWLEPMPEGEPAMSGRLVLNPEIVEWMTLGTVSKPRFSMDFPAEYIDTEMAWDDLVLPSGTKRQIQEIKHWIHYNDTLLHELGMKKKIKPGYRALFYGPPGTGKTLTATLLGKQTGKDVFRIDLSRIISKYIGETEKNLSRLFERAENKDWILFFDEADALFGKRTEIRDAHDKYANQEVAYLLQRIESYHGLVILASNQRANIDEAFIRRFQAIIHFPMPRAEDRAEIWRKTMPVQIEIHSDIDWQKIANRYEMSGASILNVTHYCLLEILAEDRRFLDLALLEVAIQREFIKEGKVF